MDEEEAKELARQMIGENGREINLITQKSLNTEMPWKMDNSETIRRTIYGVPVPPSSGTQFGLVSLGTATNVEEEMIRSEKVYIVYPDGNDLTQFRQVEDLGVVYGIQAIQVLQPQREVLLGFIGVRR